MCINHWCTLGEDLGLNPEGHQRCDRAVKTEQIIKKQTHNSYCLPVLLSVFSQDGFLFSVSIVSGLVCITLAVIKFMLGRVLTSRALITDGRCSNTADCNCYTVFEQFVKRSLFIAQIHQ